MERGGTQTFKKEDEEEGHRRLIRWQAVRTFQREKEGQDKKFASRDATNGVRENAAQRRDEGRLGK